MTAELRCTTCRRADVAWLAAAIVIPTGRKTLQPRCSTHAVGLPAVMFDPREDDVIAELSYILTDNTWRPHLALDVALIRQLLLDRPRSSA